MKWARRLFQNGTPQLTFASKSEVNNGGLCDTVSFREGVTGRAACGTIGGAGATAWG
jgi:hypothetical protein